MWKLKKKSRAKIVNGNKEDPVPKAVLFVPLTVGIMLAKELKAAELELFKLTGYITEIVERSFHIHS